MRQQQNNDESNSFIRIERWLLWEDTDTMVVDIVQNVMVQEIVIIQDVLMMEQEAEDIAHQVAECQQKAECFC